MSIAPGAIRSTGSLGAPDGVRLFYRRWSLPRPRAALLVVHGMGEHSGRYEAFAEAMLSEEISVFAYDQRGHGESGGRRGDVDAFGAFLGDLDRVRREVRELLPVRAPHFVLGHSLGGLVVLRYLQEYESSFRGGVVVSPWLASAKRPPGWLRLVAAVLQRVAPGLRLPRGADPDLLSRDREIVRRWEEDPLVHRVITPRLFTEAREAQRRALDRPDRIRLPLLFLLAGADRIADAGVAEGLARSIPRDDVEVRWFEDDYHEILNELDREAAWSGIARWIRIGVGAAPPVDPPEGGETTARNGP